MICLEEDKKLSKSNQTSAYFPVTTPQSMAKLAPPKRLRTPGVDPDATTQSLEISAHLPGTPIVL